jgi:hypothetical protein
VHLVNFLTLLFSLSLFLSLTHTLSFSLSHLLLFQYLILSSRGRCDVTASQKRKGKHISSVHKAYCHAACSSRRGDEQHLLLRRPWKPRTPRKEKKKNPVRFTPHPRESNRPTAYRPAFFSASTAEPAANSRGVQVHVTTRKTAAFRPSTVWRQRHTLVLIGQKRRNSFSPWKYTVEPQFTYFSIYVLSIYVLIFLNALLYIRTQSLMCVLNLTHLNSIYVLYK